MYLSIVTTLYHSARHLGEFYTRITAEAKKITGDYEIIFVNDGSPDDSLAVALSLYRSDPRVRVFDLSRNFGHHKAIMTGLSKAQGELIFLIDCDLEEEPELLGIFHEAFTKARTVDVVYGVQGTRKGSWFEKVSGQLFYKIFNLLSTQPIPENLVIARLMSCRYIKELLRYEENEMIISGLFAATGFEQQPITIHKHSTSRTTYNFATKFAYLIKAITAFSNKPLIYIAYVGGLIMTISLLYICYLITLYVVKGTIPEGFTSLIVSVWFLGGLIVFSVGIVAIYLSVIFTEVKHRPYSIIRQSYEHGDKD